MYTMTVPCMSRVEVIPPELILQSVHLQLRTLRTRGQQLGITLYIFIEDSLRRYFH